MKRGEVLLGALVSCLEILDLKLAILFAQHGDFFHNAAFCFGRIAGLEPEFLHLRQDTEHASEVAENFLEARRVIVPAGKHGEAGTPRGTAFESEVAAHHRVTAFGLNGILVPNKTQEIVPVVGAWAAVQDRFHVLETVEGAPGLEISLFPGAVLQVRMMSQFMLGIVEVEIRVHPLAAAQHVEVVHGAGQRHEDEKRGVVRADLVHEEFQIAADGIDSVEREADDVADMSGNVGIAVGLNELAIFADLLLLLAGGGEVAGIHALHADEDVQATGLAGLVDEVLDFPGEDVDLHHESHGNFFLGAQANEDVENGFPILVAGKIVVGEEIEGDAVFVVVAANGLGNVLRGAETHFAALNVDDGAEGAFERAAAAAIEGAKIGSGELAEIFPANGGDGLGVEVGLVVQEIVERLQAAVNGIVQQVAPGFFDLPFDDGNTRVQELLYIGRDIREKGEIAADMEPADQNGKAGAPKGVSKIASAGELIGLHADKAHDAFGETPALGTADALDGDFVHSFIEQVNLYLPGVAQTLLPDNVFGEPGETRERVARKNAAKMAHHITVIIILGRLDEIEVKGFAHFTGRDRDQIRGRSEAGATLQSW